MTDNAKPMPAAQAEADGYTSIRVADLYLIHAAISRAGYKVCAECPRCIGYKLQISGLEENLRDQQRLNTQLYNDWESMRTGKALLNKEIKNIIHDTGGHFCPDWDFLFILPKSKEAEACTCTDRMNGQSAETEASK